MTAAVRTIVATGGHSGLGLAALESLLASTYAAPGSRLILYARDPSAAHCQAAHRELSRSGKVTVDLRQMDLASLASVRTAAQLLRSEMEREPNGVIDLLLMNAAVAKSSRVMVQDSSEAAESAQPDQLRDSQGRYETTACVNHVAHLLFLSHLSPLLRRERQTRIVFTGSALHRQLKDLSRLEYWFHPSSQAEPWDLRESYAASKFLQMLGVRAFRRHLEQLGSTAEVVVVQPGFVPQTGLARETSWLGRLAMNYLLPRMPFATSVQQAGEYIARACSVDLSQAAQQDIKSEPDGWASDSARVRSALFQKGPSGLQEVSLPDPRSADVELQAKWWPTVCDETNPQM